MRLTSKFDPCLSHRLMCTDVTMLYRCLLFYDLSLSVQGHLISLKYLQQASSPDPHPIPYTPSIYPSIHPSFHPSIHPSISPSHRSSLPLFVVKVKSNWIPPSLVYPLSCYCNRQAAHVFAFALVHK